MPTQPQESAAPKPKTQEETLVEAIRRISDGMKRLQRVGMNYDGVVALLHDSTKMGKRDIEHVIDNLAQLEKRYCTTKEVKVK